MSFAIRKDGAGWRSVDGPDDCNPDEDWAADQPPQFAGPNPRILEIDAALSAIDAKGARPSRDIAAALAAGLPAPDAAVTKLADLEAQAEPLRTERKTLTA